MHFEDLVAPSSQTSDAFSARSVHAQAESFHLQARQIAVAESARVLFHPSGSIVQCFELLTGEYLYSLKGHMDAINACCFNQATQDLYTGSNDHQICTWSGTNQSLCQREEDEWSL